MKIWILASLVIATTSASALNLNPELDAPVCLQRVYSKNHLKENPRQKLSEVTILLEKNQYEDSSETYQTAKVVGRSVKNGKLYGNTAWGAGGGKYQIDCDGGSFSIVPRSNETSEWANFVVTPNYYFPLYKGVLQPDTDKMGQENYDLDLQGDDANNNVWRLEEAPVSACEEKISQLSNADGGC